MNLQPGEPSEITNISSEASGTTKILPPAGNEIPVMLKFTLPDLPDLPDLPQYFGYLLDDLDTSPAFLIRLGTRVSDSHPSCVGFRVMLRNSEINPQPIETMEDAYHVVSFKFKPDGQHVLRHGAATMDQFLNRKPNQSLGSKEEFELHTIDFDNLSNGLEVTSYGAEPDLAISGMPGLMTAVKALELSIELSLTFIHDDHLVRWLQRTIQQGYNGVVGPLWSAALPASLVPSWPSNSQTRMVAGSTDIINVLQRALREPVLDDAPITALNTRPKAQQFKAFVEKVFPSLEQESKFKLYPVMLNIVEGRCIELPFGGSMLNHHNTCAAINVLHKMLDSAIDPTNIGIAAFYPAQVEDYDLALATCHDDKPARGYNLVKAANVEDWVGGEREFMIVDLVRTQNASGNLGLLSQHRRLKVALTLHQNGLIIVGNRKCTLNAEGKITSTKLEKVLGWLQANGRIIDTDDKGDPVNVATQKAWAHYNSSASAIASASTTRTYVGIRELEKDVNKLQRPTLAKRPAGNTTNRAMKFHKTPFTEKLDASSSFARQLLLLSGRTCSTAEDDEGPQSAAGRTEHDQCHQDHLRETKATEDPTMPLRSNIEQETSSETLQEEAAAHKILPPHLQKNHQAATSPDATRNPIAVKGEPAVDLRKPQQEYTNDKAGKPKKGTAPTKAHPALSLLDPTVPTRAMDRRESKEEENLRLTPITPLSPTSSASKGDENAGSSSTAAPLSEHTREQVGEVKGKHVSPVSKQLNEPLLQPYATQSPGSSYARQFVLADRSDRPNQSQTIAMTPATPFPHQQPLHPQPSSQAYQPQQPQTQPDIQAIYQNKFNSIQSIFQNLHSLSPSLSLAPSPEEDRSFRRLRAAFAAKDRMAFDHAYEDLVEVVKKALALE